MPIDLHRVVVGGAQTAGDEVDKERTEHTPEVGIRLH